MKFDLILMSSSHEIIQTLPSFFFLSFFFHPSSFMQSISSFCLFFFSHHLLLLFQFLCFISSSLTCVFSFVFQKFSSFSKNQKEKKNINKEKNEREKIIVAKARTKIHQNEKLFTRQENVFQASEIETRNRYLK